MAGQSKVHPVSMPISTERLPAFIGQVLKPHLPYSLPLLRRCQQHANQHRPSSEVWFVTTPQQPTGEQQTLDENSFRVLTSGTHWLAAHLDLSNAGQTQVWMFASWEAEYSVLPEPQSSVRGSREFPIYQQLLNALFEHIQTEHITKLSPDPPEQWQRLRTSGKIVSLPYSRSKVLFGTLAECHWFFLDDYGVTTGEGISREDKGYLKYIISSRRSSLIETEAPGSLHFASMQEKHLQTILDRTNIPRTIETLRQLHNVGLFDPENVPVAWGLLGKDASVSSLHTEPKYRRQGLAEAVSKRLLADQTKIFVDSTDEVASDDIVYAHADVSETNMASRKVMEKLGGIVMWKVAWIEVELGESPRD